jgi:hypothetical protein
MREKALPEQKPILAFGAFSTQATILSALGGDRKSF